MFIFSLKVKKALVLWSIAFCLSSTSLQAYNRRYLNNIVSEYQNTYCPVVFSNDDEDETLEIVVEKKPAVWKRVVNWYTPLKFKLSSPSLIDKTQYAFQMLDLKPLVEQSVAQKELVAKMAIVQGEGNKQKNVAAALSNNLKDLKTQLGSLSLVTMLAQPTNNIEVIRDRQAVLKELLSNDQLLFDCDKALHIISEKEDTFLSWLDKTSDVYSHHGNRLYWQFLTGMNGSSKTLYSGVLYNDVTLLDGMFPSIKQKLGVNDLLSKCYTKFVPQALQDIRDATAQGLTKAKSFMAGGNENVLYAFSVATNVYMKLALLKICSMRATEHNYLSNLQKASYDTKLFVESLVHISELSKKSEILSKHFKDTLDVSGIEDADCKELIGLLQANSFDNELSLAYTAGSVLRMRKLLENKNVFAKLKSVFQSLGELDALVAIAHTMKTQNKEHVKYCFVEFDEKSTKPYISAKDCWNPLLSIDSVVSNTLNVGTPSAPCLILTGPNTGGKSSLLKSFMANAVLAQTFGIAAAEKFVMTPFSKLVCHMNIADDIGRGKSLFQAEVDQAQVLKNTLKMLPENQFAFVIIDEIFTGTSPEQAEKLSYQFIKQLSECENCIFINATHFKKITDLEIDTNGICKNHHMEALVGDNGQVKKYTYKIKSGISPVKNAAQVAELAFS